MVTIQNLKEIYQELTNDDNFCRLLIYNDNPLDPDKPDVKDYYNENFDEILKSRIRFSPQIDDLADNAENRILVYKSFTKINSENDSMRKNTISVDIFVPNDLVQMDFRIYSLEDKISSLIENMTLTGVGKISYTSGVFNVSPIPNYSLFVMSFSKREGRKPYAKH